MASVASTDGSHAVNMQDRVLHNLVRVALEAANTQLEPFVLRLIDALIKQADTSSDAKQASVSFNAANLLKKKSATFRQIISTHLQEALQNEINNAKSKQKPGRTRTEYVLSLVPYDEMEKDLLVKNLIRPLDAKHADQLTALRVRIGYLLGREELSVNPFRPEILLTTVNASWEDFHPDSDAHGVILPLLQPDVFLDIAPILAAVNKELINAEVLPELSDLYKIKKTTSGLDSSKKNNTLDSSTVQQLRQIFGPQINQAAATSAPMIPTIPMIPMIQGLPVMPAAPMIPPHQASGLGGNAGNPDNLQTDFPVLQNPSVQAPIISPQLLHFLNGIQKNLPMLPAANEQMMAAPTASVLSNIKRQAPQGALTQIDEKTIDLLSRIFEVLFSDKYIPPEIKEQIGVLQVPVLKTALVDKEFFFKEDHPARRLIELLTKACVGLEQTKDKDSPLYQTIKRNIDRVQEEFDHHDSVFSEVVGDLESFLQYQEEISTEALSAPISQALRQEKQHEATKAARAALDLRLDTGEVLTFIENFLEKMWEKVLTLAYSIKEEKPKAVEITLKTMDDLIWSVKSKTTAEERKELIAKLPSMLSMLNKWLKLVKLNDAEVLDFFAELAECHASIVRAPLGTTPQKQLDMMKHVAQRAEERRVQKQAEEKEAPHIPDVTNHVINQIENLERGMWLEFTEKNVPPRKIKLSWISPLRSLYIFSGQDKTDSFSLSAKDLSAMLNEGRAHVISLGGLVNRAITEALETVGTAPQPLH